MTKFVKKSEITSSWFEIDAKNAVVGRLAAIISKIIRGKNKNTFTPHMDHGDFVVVKNIEMNNYYVIFWCRFDTLAGITAKVNITSYNRLYGGFFW